MKKHPLLLLAAFILLATASSFGGPGDPDPTFGSGGVVTSSISVRRMALQSDQKIVGAGYEYSAVVGRNVFALVRYNVDGSPDTTFNNTGKVTTTIGVNGAVAWCVAIQSDGKIVAAGASGDTSSNQRIAVARYYADGSLDTTFNGTGIVITAVGNYAVSASCIALQSDGKILVGGSASVLRYNPNGSLDNTFNGTGIVTDPGVSGPAGLAVQSDGKIVFTGTVQRVSPLGGTEYDIVVVRHNTDGSPDTTFNGTGKVTTDFRPDSRNEDEMGLGLAIQSDQKIVVSGFGNITNDYDFAVVRYRTDGTLDTTFNGQGWVVAPVIANSHEKACGVALQNDQKIVITGQVTYLSNAPPATRWCATAPMGAWILPSTALDWSLPAVRTW